MASEVDICKMALAHCRAGSINSLNEASVQAQQCSLFFNFCRDKVLEDFSWGFARKVAVLAELTTAEVFDWAYCYVWPSDCLHINHLLRNLESTSASAGDSMVALRLDNATQLGPVSPIVEHDVYNVGGVLVIGANEADLRIDYRSKVETVNLWSPNFRIALAYYLAAMVAIPIVGVKDGQSLRKDSLQLYDAFINQAQANSAMNGKYRNRDSEYIRAQEW